METLKIGQKIDMSSVLRYLSEKFKKFGGEPKIVLKNLEVFELPNDSNKFQFYGSQANRNFGYKKIIGKKYGILFEYLPNNYGSRVL